MISETVSPSPLNDATEFLFPAMSCPVEQQKADEFVLGLMQSDAMANNIDFCEVFTDLDNFLSSQDAGHLIQQPLPCESLSDENFTTLSAVPSPTATPDHSYSTVLKPMAHKRKCNESPAANDDVDDDDDEASNDTEVVVVKRSKYLERRKKNNIASKRSREIRKNKFVEMDEQSSRLERANEELRARIEQLESLTKKMKEALVARLSTSQ
jgi:hypothetical protein